MQKLRLENKISLLEMERKTGISDTSIRAYESGKTRLRKENAIKIANVLDCDYKELNKKVSEKNEIIYNTKCLNQACPLNQDCICINDTVLTGKADCFGKDRVKDKVEYKKMNSTNYLFRI